MEQLRRCSWARSSQSAHPHLGSVPAGDLSPRPGRVGPAAGDTLNFLVGLNPLSRKNPNTDLSPPEPVFLSFHSPKWDYFLEKSMSRQDGNNLLSVRLAWRVRSSCCSVAGMGQWGQRPPEPSTGLRRPWPLPWANTMEAGTLNFLPCRQ